MKITVSHDLVGWFFIVRDVGLSTVQMVTIMIFVHFVVLVRSLTLN